jgi:cobalt-zinc-cadmium efflux system outer membrane protein
VHLREQEVSLALQLQDAATLRVEVGDASELEQMNAEIQLAEAESRLEDARRQFQNARYTLFNVVGLDPEEQRYEIEFPDTLVYIDAGIDQGQVMARLDDQPELQSANRSVDAAALGVKQTRSALLPAISFDYYTQDYGSGFDWHGFQIGLKVPLWLIPNYKGNIRKAQAEAQTWQWRRDAVALVLKKQAEQAWHGYETSKNKIDRYRTTTRARSNELLRLTLEGYRMGEVGLLALLETQRTYLTSQQRFYDALHDYYYQLIELERFLGNDIVFNPAYE